MTTLQACVDLCEKGIKSTHTVTIAHRSSSEPQPKKQKPNNILTTPELVNNYAPVHEPFECHCNYTRYGKGGNFNS